MGRPPAQTTPKKAPKKFDAPAYAVFLEELAEAVRTVLGVGADVPVPVQCLQDGAKFHWGPEAKKVAAELLLQFFKDFPAYFPDLNPIESVFSILVAELASKGSGQKSSEKRRRDRKTGAAPHGAHLEDGLHSEYGEIDAQPPSGGDQGEGQCHPVLS